MVKNNDGLISHQGNSLWGTKGSLDMKPPSILRAENSLNRGGG